MNRINLPFCFHLTIFGIIGCNSDTTTKQFNNAPTIAIQSHVSGATIEEGVETQFYAVASDLNDQTSDLLVSWYLDENLVCDWEAPDLAGSTQCTFSLFSDSQVVAAIVTIASKLPVY